MGTDKTIKVKVKLDRKTFRDFALYDAFVLKKRWIRPMIFCAIMTASAAVALIFGKEQQGLIAGVLLAAGIGLPAVYILSFLSQIRAQAEKNRLSADKEVYTVFLGCSGVTVHNRQRENEVLDIKWNDVTAYRRKSCIYLYYGQNRAFLLPHGQADVSDSEMWEFITTRISQKQEQQLTQK